MSEAEIRELIRASNSKKELYKLFKKNKVNTPEFVFAFTWTQLKDWAYNYPLLGSSIYYGAYCYKEA